MKHRLLATALCMLLIGSVNGFPQPPQMRQGPPGRGNNITWQQQTRMQNRGAFISGLVVLSPDEEGGEEVPGTGVIVTVISGKDTLRAVTDDKRGAFFIVNAPVGKAYVSFSLMGYKTQAKTVTLVQGQNRMIANLEPEPLSLGEAVLQEDIPAATLVGDTIIFNAAAVKVNKGEIKIV